MTSLAFSSISVAISYEFMLLKGTITWCYTVIHTGAYFVKNAAMRSALILYWNKCPLQVRENSFMGFPSLAIGLS